MKNGTFGLDIGTTATKAVWLTQKKEGLFLNAAVKGPTPSPGIQSVSPLDQETTAQAIVKLISSAKIVARDVVVALPESQVYTRVVELPVISEKELATAMMWQVEQYIPVPVDTLKIDWQVLSRPPEGSNQRMQILLVGAPIALIERYQKAIELTGLNLVAIETEILAAARSLAPPGATPTSLIVHIGAISTAFAIVKEGTVLFTYNIPTGALAINRAIASDFGFTTAQAEEYKRAYGISKDLIGAKLGNATQPILLSIATEMTKVVTFYVSKSLQEDRIMQIVLSGGTARLGGLDLFFAEHCGVETVVGNPWKVLASQQVPQEILNDAPEYAVAVGLAIKDV